MERAFAPKGYRLQPVQENRLPATGASRILPDLGRDFDRNVA